MRVSSSTASKNDMFKCSACHAFKEKPEFMKGDRKLNSCLSCRVVYVKKQEAVTGQRRCGKCKTAYPLKDFISEYNQREFSTCHSCRLAWFESQTTLSVLLTDDPAESLQVSGVL